MKNINEITKEEAQKIEYILTDIDGTLTNDGPMLPEAYEALWKLHNAGFKIIPVTGRTAGWASVNITDWPVEAIIAESGSVVFYLENGSRKNFIHPSISGNIAEEHEKILSAVREKYPNVKVSIDQFSRFNDFAFNYAEEPEDALPYEQAQDILGIVKSLGGQGNISSIHINTWFGDYDKLPMTRLYFKERLGIDEPKNCAIYFGDATNDEPMFEYFETACGVRNIMRYAHLMQHLPKYITTKEGGLGFAEAADILIALKKG